MLRLATPLSALAVAGASLALAACGSSSDNNNSSSTGSGASSGQSGTRNADFQKFQQCLKDNGVTLPNRGNGGPGGSNAAPPNTDGGAPPSNATPPNGTPPQGGGYGGGPGGFGGQSSDPKVQKAMQACAKYRPQGGFRGGNGNGPGGQQNIKAFTAYLTCLKDKGLDVKVSDGFNALRNLKQSDPKVQAALKSCQSKLPQRPQASSAAPTNTTTT